VGGSRIAIEKHSEGPDWAKWGKRVARKIDLFADSKLICFGRWKSEGYVRGMEGHVLSGKMREM
jgi:hypothetical protein